MYSFFVLYSLGLCERLEQKMRKVINRSHTPTQTKMTHGKWVTLHCKVWRKSCRSMACPSWLRPGGSLGHLKARTRGQWMMQIFQPELLENIFGAKPPKRRHPEIPCQTHLFQEIPGRQCATRQHACHQAVTRQGRHGAKPETETSPRPFREGWNLASARFPSVTAAVAKCVVFTKRNGVSKLLTLWMGGESKSNKKH